MRICLCGIRAVDTVINSKPTCNVHRMPRISEKTLKVQDSECIDTSCLSVFMCSMMLINTAVISEYNLNIWTF